MNHTILHVGFVARFVADKVNALKDTYLFVAAFLAYANG